MGWCRDGELGSPGCCVQRGLEEERADPKEVRGCPAKAGPERRAKSPSERAGRRPGPGTPVRAAGWLLEAGLPGGRTGVFVPEPRARRRGWRFRGAVESSGAVARGPGAALPTPGPQLLPRGRYARPEPSGAGRWGWGARAANWRGPPCGLCRPGTRRQRAGHLGPEGRRRERPCWHRHREPGAARGAPCRGWA